MKLKRAICPYCGDNVPNAIFHDETCWGVKHGLPPKELDFVPTPPSATGILLANEAFEGTIGDFSCGDGAIATPFEAKYPGKVSGSDIYNHGYGLTGPEYDFLAGYGKDGPEFERLTSKFKVDNIIMNPPHSLRAEFKRQAIRLARKKVALFMPLRNGSTYLEGSAKWGGSCRSARNPNAPLKAIYHFNKSTDWIDRKINWKMAWYVWEHGYVGEVIQKRIWNLR